MNTSKLHKIIKNQGSKFRKIIKFLQITGCVLFSNLVSAEDSLDLAQSIRLQEWEDRNTDLALKNTILRLQESSYNSHYPRARSPRQIEDVENWTLTKPPFNYGFLPFGTCADMPLPQKYLDLGQKRQCCPEADSSCKQIPVHPENPSNRTCYCDLACKSWKDCCSDYLESCAWQGRFSRLHMLYMTSRKM